uniref:Uncharacterized protein n=1 Tax=Anguilla anguilla TaxID=7936 RepID=A0A0E9W2U0_ANGAN
MHKITYISGITNTFVARKLHILTSEGRIMEMLYALKLMCWI